ncbi:MAG: MBL fold metallo-hydrolase, partial [Bacillota bacterium]
LAAFAAVLKEHRASVIHMSYDGRKAPGLVEMAMATQRPDEVSALLQDLNQRGYHYHVEWQGASGSSIDQVIGLSLVERFLLNLKALLPREKLDELGELIRSSEELRQTLLSFKREAGGSDESMAASEVFSSILQLATSSISKTGRGFSLRLTGPLELTEQVQLYMLTCPTGANGYLLRCRDQLTLIDSSYGLYWPDVKKWLAAHGLDPACIHVALFTHPDADHAGWAAPLQEEYGAEIYMHPDSADIFRHENRAYGSGTRLMALNGYYTKLINRFTDLRAPQVIHPFPPARGEASGLKILGRFEVGDIEFQILESLGGHVPAQAFFYAPRQGLLFCGDYLIDFSSLSDRAKSTLSIARFLMTSTNSDSRVFGQEMGCLARLMLETEARLRPEGKFARIFPGHGEFYRVDEAEAMLKGLAG